MNEPADNESPYGGLWNAATAAFYRVFELFEVTNAARRRAEVPTLEPPSLGYPYSDGVGAQTEPATTTAATKFHCSRSFRSCAMTLTGHE
jgi:hypothetical protein